MDKKETELIVKRIERFYQRIGQLILEDSIKLDALFFHCQKPAPFEKRLDGDYSPIDEGTNWGKFWESGWFHLKGKVPKEWRGEKVVAQLDFDGEGLVFDNNGNIIQGISNGSVFQHDFNRDIVHLFDKSKGNEEVDLWVETAANGLFGMFTEPDPSIDSENRYGHYDAKVNKIRLAVFNEVLWHLWLDIRILRGLILRLPEKSVRRARIIKNLNDAINIFADNPKNAELSRIELAKELNKPADASALQVTAIGHAHIDTAWLWPVRESIRKCARTFASQLNLIDRYPEYIFGASQPQHYQFIKDHYPKLYDRIKKAISNGRWEPQGAMWVEADCNLISGESMVRQVLHGKNFFKDEFDIDINHLWLPDVFGYSAALPQILKKSGVDYFLTQKISWNQINEFPHHTFNWRGIDGSEVLTHSPPENTYNSQLDTEYLVPAQEHFKEKAFINEFISLFGVGDGGGGPKEENIELGHRMKNLESAPQVSFGTAKAFFKKLNEYKDSLPKWVGELYLELHRGTLTTQAFVKKANRRLEDTMQNIEMLASLLPIEEYPQQELDEIWKVMLLNQFHDIIPGSSITEVYRTTEEEYSDAFVKIENLLNKIAKQLFEPDENSFILFNSMSYSYNGSVEFDIETDEQFVIVDSNNKEIIQQNEKDKIIALVSLPPLSFTVLKKKTGSINPTETRDSLILENNLIRYSFNDNGCLVSIFDKEVQKEILEENQLGNLLTLYDDHPNDWDAWDIDKFYEEAIIEYAKVSSKNSLTVGAVRSSIKFSYSVGDSQISQNIYLDNNSKLLNFETNVDWHEKHRMLRVSFPVDIRSEQATFDIQYGYVKRPTHRNTSWDYARFEVVGHRYADLSDNDYGVALLNDCKYGYKVYDNILDLNLLRSPNYPDPDADQGQHAFTYSLLPHTGDLIHSNVIAEAALLNQGVQVINGFNSNTIEIPWQLTGEGVVLEVVKKAEKENCLIIRLVERKGCHSRCNLQFSHGKVELIETDMMEWEEINIIGQGNSFDLSFKPFEIKTFKLKNYEG